MLQEDIDHTGQTQLNDLREERDPYHKFRSYKPE